MAKFVELTKGEARTPFFVNPDHVIFVEKGRRNDESKLILIHGRSEDVNGSPSEVAEKLGK